MDLTLSKPESLSKMEQELHTAQSWSRVKEEGRVKKGVRRTFWNMWNMGKLSSGEELLIRVTCNIVVDCRARMQNEQDEMNYVELRVGIKVNLIH